METIERQREPIQHRPGVTEPRGVAEHRSSPLRPELSFSRDFDPAAQNLLLNARVLFRNGEVELAKSLLAESLRINPENRRALLLLRDCFEATQELANALKINLSLEADCEDPVLMKKTGDLALQLGQDQVAQQAYLRALEHFESDEKDVFEILKSLGNLALRSGDIEGAQEYYHRAFRLQPESESLLVNLGTLHIQRGDFDGAIQRFQEAIAISPKAAKAFVGLAMCYREIGDTDLAWGNLKQALDIDGSLLTALQLCVAWGLADAQTSLAIQRLRFHLEKQPTDDQMTYMLAALLIQAKRFDDAWFETQKLFWINPSHPGLPQLMADLQSPRSAA